MRTHNSQYTSIRTSHPLKWAWGHYSSSTIRAPESVHWNREVPLYIIRKLEETGVYTGGVLIMPLTWVVVGSWYSNEILDEKNSESSKTTTNKRLHTHTHTHGYACVHSVINYHSESYIHTYSQCLTYLKGDGEDSPPSILPQFKTLLLSNFCFPPPL